MKIFGKKLFNWKLGRNERCMVCKHEIEDTGQTNVIRIQTSEGLIEKHICNSCADDIDKRIGDY